jgi:ribosomal 50S subunit-associated protein YjgA (DUF615 family)
MSPRDDDRSNRQIARSKVRRDGDRTARLANALMKLGPAALKSLELEDSLHEAIVRARAVTAPIARRRAERTLAGDLRRFETDDLERQLTKVHDGNVDQQQFHLIERWRTRLIAEGMAAAAEFPGGASDELARLVAAAQRERDTGKPPGAARSLFRHIADALKAERRASALAEGEPPDDE